MMSVIIIVGGTGRLHKALDDMNAAASAHNWTQAQIAAASAKVTACADELEKMTTSFNAGNPP